MERMTHKDGKGWYIEDQSVAYDECRRGEDVDRLAAYEDTELEPEAVAQLKQIAKIFNCDPTDPAQLKALYVKLQVMAQAERDGRLVVLPEVPEDDRQAFVEGLQDYFQDASNYDPSVGIFGMRGGEAKLANALMEGLRRLEDEHGPAQV